MNRDHVRLEAIRKMQAKKILDRQVARILKSKDE
jgi:hypothetical protein